MTKIFLRDCKGLKFEFLIPQQFHKISCSFLWKIARIQQITNPKANADSKTFSSLCMSFLSNWWVLIILKLRFSSSNNIEITLSFTQQLPVKSSTYLIFAFKSHVFKCPSGRDLPMSGRVPLPSRQNQADWPAPRWWRHRRRRRRG